MHKDIEKVLVTEAQLHDRVKELGRRITTDYAGKSLLLVGVLKGAAVFMSDLMREIELDVETDYLVVSSYGLHTEAGELTFSKDVSVDIAGRDVLIVEDMIDTGTTMHRLLEVLAERQPNSLAVASLLSKPARREKEVETRYIGFEVPNEFVVGYGLDFAEKYRNLPYVGVLHPECYR
ncbi:MAG: hypoxanthine phosphoribosyltransferase [Veillonellaceae bacterium]|nr:hypoxanthine phosphoribosyltransferase [Veillonellaceae bacterium]